MARVREHLENFNAAHNEAREAEEFKVRVAALKAGSQDVQPHVENLRAKLE